MADEQAEARPADATADTPSGESGRAVRTAGHCVACNRFVEAGPAGECPNGHAPQLVTGSIPLQAGAELPDLGRFNLAAFLIPPIWGVWYRQWIGLFFVPLWIFANNAYQAGVERGGSFQYAAFVLFAANLALHVWFGLKGNALAWRAVGGRQSVERFRRTQRWWALGAVALWAAIGVWLVAFDAGVRL